MKVLKRTTAKDPEGLKRVASYDPNNKSLWIFSEKSKIRIFANSLIKKKWFDFLILFFIFVSTLTLAVENPLSDPESTLASILYYLDIVLTTIFTIEAILKVITYGFLTNGGESYLRNYWNIVDFFIVLFSVSY